MVKNINHLWFQCWKYGSDESRKNRIWHMKSLMHFMPDWCVGVPGSRTSNCGGKVQPQMTDSRYAMADCTSKFG
jgi:hypothetical protein